MNYDDATLFCGGGVTCLFFYSESSVRENIACFLFKMASSSPPSRDCLSARRMLLHAPLARGNKEVEILLRFNWIKRKSISFPNA